MGELHSQNAQEKKNQANQEGKKEREKGKLRIQIFSRPLDIKAWKTTVLRKISHSIVSFKKMLEAPWVR